MKKEILAIIGIAVCFSFVPVQVIYGQADKVDPEIKQVYEYYSGQSLEDAVADISGNNRSPQSTVGDTGLASPNAPEVDSKGASPKCYTPSKSPSIVSLPDEPIHILTVQQLQNHHSVRLLDNGERIFHLYLKYEGDISDLVPLGLKLKRALKQSQGEVSVEFPISLLPVIARHKNVKGVSPGAILAPTTGFHNAVGTVSARRT